MFNLTLKNFGQKSSNVKPDKLNNFLESMDVEELDDAALAEINGGADINVIANAKIPRLIPRVQQSNEEQLYPPLPY